MKLTEDFDQIIKTEKRKKLLKTIGISLATTVVVLVAGFSSINHRMATQNKKAQEIMNLIDMVQSPNITSVSQYLSVSGRMNSQLKSDRLKNVDGYMLSVPPLEVNYDLLSVIRPIENSPIIDSSTSSGDENKQGYNFIAFSRENGHKIPLFFNPNRKTYYEKVGYEKLFHEATSLATLKNHVAEVAVTFEQPLTYAEIQKKIPGNLLINWYWIGTNDDKLSLQALAGQGMIGINADKTGKLTDFALTKSQKEMFDYPTTSNYPSFVFAVEKLAKTQKFTVTDFEEVTSSGGVTTKSRKIDIYQDALKQVKKYPSLKTAKFSGVIVSGRTENLAKLDELPDVYATNVGLETKILPYIEPTK
jgi:hypothetical protein